MTQGTQMHCSVTAWRMGGEGGGRRAQEGGDTYVPVANSCCYMAEAIST